MSQPSLGTRVRRRTKRLLDRVRGIDNYADPKQYWEDRHDTYGARLEGVGTIALAEDLNEQEYALKWAHLSDVLEATRARSADSLLDAGCGNGFFSQRALELGFSVDAVDFSTEAIRIAKEQPGREGIRWHRSELDTFVLPDRFDVVMTIDVLFHIVDDATWQRTVERLAAFVAPAGTLVVQEHLVGRDDYANSHGNTHVHWRTLDRYRQALTDWRLISHDHYELPTSSSWKDLVVFRRGLKVRTD